MISSWQRSCYYFPCVLFSIPKWSPSWTSHDYPHPLPSPPCAPPALKVSVTLHKPTLLKQSGPSSQTDALIHEIFVRTQTQLISVWDKRITRANKSSVHLPSSQSIGTEYFEACVAWWYVLVTCCNSWKYPSFLVTCLLSFFGGKWAISHMWVIQVAGCLPLSTKAWFI